MKSTLYSRVRAALLRRGYEIQESYYSDNGRPVIIVSHDYEGLYPTPAVLAICSDLSRISAYYGVELFTPYARTGSTFIFNKEDKTPSRDLRFIDHDPAYYEFK